MTVYSVHDSSCLLQRDLKININTWDKCAPLGLRKINLEIEAEVIILKDRYI